jgi:hypothetical protein
MEATPHELLYERSTSQLPENIIAIKLLKSKMGSSLPCKYG